MSALFVLSQCAPCSSAWRFCTSMTGLNSCKGPIAHDLLFTLLKESTNLSLCFVLIISTSIAWKAYWKGSLSVSDWYYPRLSIIKYSMATVTIIFFYSGTRIRIKCLTIMCLNLGCLKNINFDLFTVKFLLPRQLYGWQTGKGFERELACTQKMPGAKKALTSLGDSFRLRR